MIMHPAEEQQAIPISHNGKMAEPRTTIPERGFGQPLPAKANAPSISLAEQNADIQNDYSRSISCDA